MNRKKTVLFSALFVCIVLAAGATIYVTRNINEKPPVVVDQATEVPSTQTNETPSAVTDIKTGIFNAVDAVHWGKGTAKITNSDDGVKLSFSEDFEVAQGPDLFVYLSPNLAGQDLGEYASLGALKANAARKTIRSPKTTKITKPSLFGVGRSA